MNWNNITSLINDGYLVRRKHPFEDIWILNYTPKCQYERVWTPETLACRGLIYDTSVISWPIPKFFNWEEHLAFDMPIPKGEYEVWEKLDGFMGISYPTKRGVRIATRGSFESDMALAANEMLRDYPSLNSEITYIFEIIHPELSRKTGLVVRYPHKKLVLLAAKMGQVELDINTVEWPYKAQQVSHLPFGQLKGLDLENSEGFVIRFNTGQRMKIKFDNYLQMQKIITNLTVKTLFEVWSEGNQCFIPEEYREWAEDWYARFETKFREILKRCGEAFDQAPRQSRKQFATFALKTTYPAVLFKMYDGKDCEQTIKKIVKDEILGE